MTELAALAGPNDRSWVFGANDAALGLPLQHLPYCAFEDADSGEIHLGVLIGACVLDLHRCSSSGLFGHLPEIASACQTAQLNGLMALGNEAWDSLRTELQMLLRVGGEVSGERRHLTEAALLPARCVEFVKAVNVPDYTDFYASIHHATRVGQIFRPDQPLLPNYKYIPIGYHGRASSIVANGVPVKRPRGQLRPVGPGEPPIFGPTAALDYELELAFYAGVSNAQGTSVAIEDAERRLFGVSLLNDWSARDIQAWEYQPLGPFLGKSFATSVSAWITPMAALEPFRIPPRARSAEDPQPLGYLLSDEDQRSGGLNVMLEVLLLSQQMKDRRMEAVRLSQSNASDLYWTPAQLVAHHTSNGCNLQRGDVLATGTISGAAETAAGCLLELTRNGTRPISLPNGETRAFLEDGDEVILRGYCEATGHPRLALGECRAVILPAG